MGEQSLYDILGVLEDASPSEIKAAYRRKMQLIHPDTGGSDEAAKRVNAAYDVLSNPARRSEYNRSRQRHALVCPMCDSPVSTDTELMEHIVRHRAEVAAAQQVVEEAAQKAKAEQRAKSQAVANREAAARSEAERARKARADAGRSAVRTDAKRAEAERAKKRTQANSDRPRVSMGRTSKTETHAPFNPSSEFLRSRAYRDSLAARPRPARKMDAAMLGAIGLVMIVIAVYGAVMALQLN